MTREELEEFQSNLAEIKELTKKLERKDLDPATRKRCEDLRASLYAKKDNAEDWVFAIEDGRIRRIFALYYLEGLSQEAVAKKLHIDRSGISRKISEYFKSHTKHEKHCYNKNS